VCNKNNKKAKMYQECEHVFTGDVPVHLECKTCNEGFTAGATCSGKLIIEEDLTLLSAR
jgi:hypothetical protein